MFMMGCASPAKRIRRVKLGMSPDEVRDQMGDPYTIRAAKIYENGNWTQIWEYQAAPFELNPKNFWIYFENGKVVQWGEPGDFAGKSGDVVPVSEYSEQKTLK
jgi:outer membrane protein assembly factor BamE (lipoprotein component of BamABCDE complex)